MKGGLSGLMSEKGVGTWASVMAGNYCQASFGDRRRGGLLKFCMCLVFVTVYQGNIWKHRRSCLGLWIMLNIVAHSWLDLTWLLFSPSAVTEMVIFRCKLYDLFSKVSKQLSTWTWTAVFDISLTFFFRFFLFVISVTK